MKKVMGLTFAALAVAGAVALGFKATRAVQAGLDKQRTMAAKWDLDTPSHGGKQNSERAREATR